MTCWLLAFRLLGSLMVSITNVTTLLKLDDVSVFTSDSDGSY